MRIGVNARLLNKPFTGIGRYTKALFSDLAQEHPNDTFVLVAHEDVAGDFPKNVEVVILPERFPGTAGMKKTFWEQVQLPAFFKKMGVDIIHYPYPSNPWRNFKIPTVVTVHDTIPWVLPEYREQLSTRLYQDRCRNALKYASLISAVSHATKNDLVSLFPPLDNKIFVAENGISSEYKSSVENAEKVLKKYNIDPARPYFLYLGGYDARKNVSLLVDVFRESVASDFDVDLVLAGGKILQGKLYESYDYAVEASKKMPESRGKLVFPGFIDEADLPVLYAHSLTFVNLSKAEGFNLPVIEALCSGTPVIASDIEIHHEVLGDYGHFVGVDDKVKLTEILRKFAGDVEFASSERAKTEAYVCPFTWQKTAQKVYQAYEKVMQFATIKRDI